MLLFGTKNIYPSQYDTLDLWEIISFFLPHVILTSKKKNKDLRFITLIHCEIKDKNYLVIFLFFLVLRNMI